MPRNPQPNWPDTGPVGAHRWRCSSEASGDTISPCDNPFVLCVGRQSNLTTAGRHLLRTQLQGRQQRRAHGYRAARDRLMLGRAGLRHHGHPWPRLADWRCGWERVSAGQPNAPSPGASLRSHPPAPRRAPGCPAAPGCRRPGGSARPSRCAAVTGAAPPRAPGSQRSRGCDRPATVVVRRCAGQRRRGCSFRTAVAEMAGCAGWRAPPTTSQRQLMLGWVPPTAAAPLPPHSCPSLFLQLGGESSATVAPPRLGWRSRCGSSGAARLCAGRRRRLRVGRRMPHGGAALCAAAIPCPRRAQAGHRSCGEPTPPASQRCAGASNQLYQASLRGRTVYL
jgi:hypothetical protein